MDKFEPKTPLEASRLNELVAEIDKHAARLDDLQRQLADHPGVRSLPTDWESRLNSVFFSPTIAFSMADGFASSGRHFLRHLVKNRIAEHGYVFVNEEMRAFLFGESGQTVSGASSCLLAYVGGFWTKFRFANDGVSDSQLTIEEMPDNNDGAGYSAAYQASLGKATSLDIYADAVSEVDLLGVPLGSRVDRWLKECIPQALEPNPHSMRIWRALRCSAKPNRSNHWVIPWVAFAILLLCVLGHLFLSGHEPTYLHAVFLLPIVGWHLIQTSSCFMSSPPGIRNSTSELRLAHRVGLDKSPFVDPVLDDAQSKWIWCKFDNIFARDIHAKWIQWTSCEIFVFLVWAMTAPILTLIVVR